MNPLVGIVTIENHDQDPLLELLSFGGLPLHQLDSIEKIHNYAYSGACDAIITPKGMLDLYNATPMQHLLNNLSPLIIIEYSTNPDNSYSFNVHAITKDIHKYESQEDPQKILFKIEKTLEKGIEYKRKLVSSCIQYNIKNNRSNMSAAESQLDLFFSDNHIINTIKISETQKKSMTPKLWKLLTCLEKKQETGVSLIEIEKALWPICNTTNSKKEDIQAYISKLRKILNCNSDNEYEIHFRDDTYFLINKNQ